VTQKQQPAMFRLRRNNETAAQLASLAARKRGGRPRLAPSAKRSRHVNVSLSSDEYALLIHRALECGLRPAEALRTLALQRKVPTSIPRLNAQMWSKLGALQGATTLLLCCRVGISDADRKLIFTLLSAVKKVRLALVSTEYFDDTEDH